MLSRLPHRRVRDLVLDTVFVVWMLQLLVTGHIVPPLIADLLRQDSPVAVVSEPNDSPQPENVAPLLPET